jgi:hypothetical protein
MGDNTETEYRQQVVEVWIGFICLRIATGGGLWTKKGYKPSHSTKAGNFYISEHTITTWPET